MRDLEVTYKGRKTNEEYVDEWITTLGTQDSDLCGLSEGLCRTRLSLRGAKKVGIYPLTLISRWLTVILGVCLLGP